MKPIRECLSELPAPYDTLALSVVDEKHEGYKAQVNSLYKAILYMCEWRNTPQHHNFWNAVSNWCIDPDNYQLPPIPAVEVEKPISEAIEKAKQENQSKPFCGFEFSPEVEQPKSLLTPFIRYVQNLEQENTELSAKLAELLSNPKELVYDAKWLANVVNNYDDIYWLSGETVSVGGITLSPKDSAPIIMAALAKELNPLFEFDGKKWFIGQQNNSITLWDTTKDYFGSDNIFTSKKSAQKAIDILTQTAPQVLKNYFA